MLSLYLFVGLTLLCLPLLYFLGRRDERKVRRDWELLLTDKGKELYRTIETRVSADMQLANITYDEAFSVRELGSVEEAKHLLDVGYKVIEKFSPSMLKLLAAMSTFSRMVSAMAPIKPLRPQGFRLAQIASLAYLNQFLHNFIVTTAERYRLRVYILGRSFGLATRFLLASTKRIAEGQPNAEKDWEQIQFVREDFQTLTDESLQSLKVLLTSLAAEGRGDLIERM
jgi:hypothetical protein